MTGTSSQPPVRYVARVHGIREVAVLGHADRAFWAARLRTERLLPVEEDGATPVLITGIRAKWKGLTFHDFSISIPVTDPADPAKSPGLYFARAYNSSRVFAFFERRWFHTPYTYCPALRLTLGPPASMEMGPREAVVFRATLADSSRLAAAGEERWEGPLFLPAPAFAPRRHLFFARIAGDTQGAEFDAQRDTLEIHPRGDNAWQALLDSGFTGRRWSIRENAVHARSKTLRRDWQPPGRSG